MIPISVPDDGTSALPVNRLERIGVQAIDRAMRQFVDTRTSKDAELFKSLIRSALSAEACITIVECLYSGSTVGVAVMLVCPENRNNMAPELSAAAADLMRLYGQVIEKDESKTRCRIFIRIVEHGVLHSSAIR